MSTPTAEPPTAAAAPVSPTLSPDQEVAVAAVMAGESIFLTGCGGTGKSFLTGKLIEGLQRKYGSCAIAVTASTGIAACHIGGVTLHSFAGIGLGTEPVEKLVQMVRRKLGAPLRWKSTKCLIIDEISMISGELFDKIEAVARRICDDTKPFGGIQLVVIGDFLQLPPVSRGGEETKFCFEAKSWPTCIQRCVELTTVFRQSDQAFVRMLSEIRVGRLTPETTEALELRGRGWGEESPDAVKPTKLFALNVEVDTMNTYQLSLLPGDGVSIQALDTGIQPYLDLLSKNCMAPSSLSLKVGAQVMLLKNIDVLSGLTNGARGVVKEITSHLGIVKVKVCFDIGNGREPLEYVVERLKFEMQCMGAVVASRSQIPLRLAYAITIHKCQGMTLTKAVIDLGGVFEYGQTYVALSRVTSLSAMKLIDFFPHRVRAHPRVLEFYAAMRA